MNVQPYLFFEGRTEEAIEFYRKAVGAEVVQMMRFKESPDPAHCPGVSLDKIMHASIKVGDATVMMSDGRAEGNPKFEGFALSLSVANVAEADRVFAALAEGGQVQMPLMQTFWSPRFGMVADRFGVSWMIIVPMGM